jgi:hypothetical protein
MRCFCSAIITLYIKYKTKERMSQLRMCIHCAISIYSLLLIVFKLLFVVAEAFLFINCASKLRHKNKIISLFTLGTEFLFANLYIVIFNF